MYKKSIVLLLLIVVISIGLIPAVLHGASQAESKAFEGYTLMAPFYHKTTYLVDMEGNIVHSWKNHSGVAAASAYFLENGNLLRTSSLPDATGPGGGMPMGNTDLGAAVGGLVQEIAWDGDVVWEFKYAADDYILNHDIERMPNGNILMLACVKKTNQEVIAAGRDPAFQGNIFLRTDYIIEVKPNFKDGGGEIVWQWHAWDHIIQDHDSSKPNYGDVRAHPELIDLNFSGGPERKAQAPARGGGGINLVGLSGDGGTVPPGWIHSNSIDYNPELDQICISSYGFSEIWIIDHSTTTEEAAGHTGGRYGKGGDLLYRWGNPRAYRAGTVKDQQLFNQHDSSWILKGRPGQDHILIFNNGANRLDGDYSSVDEIVPPIDEKGNYKLEPGKTYGPEKPVWSYTAPNKKDFLSIHISGAERLPNGNTLICSGAFGVIFEVTMEKEVVWRCLHVAGSGSSGFGGFGAPGGFGGRGFGGRGGGFGGPGFGMPGTGQTSGQNEDSSFIMTGSDISNDSKYGLKTALPSWGGGPGYGVMMDQIFRVYRYSADYPGLAGKDLTPKKDDEETS